MGMYTQIRGWLNVDSIGDWEGEHLKAIKRNLERAQYDFHADNTIQVDRKWVCEDTIAYKGSNESCYLFIGTELKNYGNPAEEWIKYLIKYFPNCEGRIDFQYEEDDEHCKFWLISKGKVIEEGKCAVWCNGYGNDFSINE